MFKNLSSLKAYQMEKEYKEYIEQYEQVGNLIGYMMSHPEKFK